MPTSSSVSPSSRPSPRERPFYLSRRMVLALQRGQKKQIRILMKQPPDGFRLLRVNGAWAEFTRSSPAPTAWSTKCKFGRPGDRLWVREGCSISEWIEPDTGISRRGIYYLANGARFEGVKDTPASQMPRSACRFVLAIQRLRAQRLHEITEEEAVAEGLGSALASRVGRSRTAIEEFHAYWDKHHRDKHPWATNPWVWVLDVEEVIDEPTAAMFRPFTPLTEEEWARIEKIADEFPSIDVDSEGEEP